MSKFHSILFLLESKNKKKIIVQRHYTSQPYKNMMLFSVQCLDSVSPVPPFFSWGPSQDVIIIWFLRQSHRKSLGLSWSPALVAPSRHQWPIPGGRQNNESVSGCRQVWVHDSDIVAQKVKQSNKHQGEVLKSCS